MGPRLIDELLADQKEDLLHKGRLEEEKKAEEWAALAERRRLLTPMLQARLGKEGTVFIDALATLKPDAHNQIAHLLVAVRGKKELIRKLNELIQES